jgi:hypothetical protein
MKRTLSLFLVFLSLFTVLFVSVPTVDAAQVSALPYSTYNSKLKVTNLKETDFIYYPDSNKAHIRLSMRVSNPTKKDYCIEVAFREGTSGSWTIKEVYGFDKNETSPTIYVSQPLSRKATKFQYKVRVYANTKPGTYVQQGSYTYKYFDYGPWSSIITFTRTNTYLYTKWFQKYYSVQFTCSASTLSKKYLVTSINLKPNNNMKNFTLST